MAALLSRPVSFRPDPEAAMWIGIDHVAIGVSNLSRGIEPHRRIGFEVRAGGALAGTGLECATACNRLDRIELLALAEGAARADSAP